MTPSVSIGGCISRRGPEQALSSLYFHIPFCLSKCAYCAFNSIPLTSDEDLTRYLALLLREMDAHEKWLSEQTIDTIYFGGGTPSLIPESTLARFIDKIFDRVEDIAIDAEITMECNPETLTRNKLTGFLTSGINRLSIGVQSFDENVLRFLERCHNARQSQAAILEARDVGFCNVSVDLIMGLPWPHQDVFRTDIETALQISPEHLSVYLLSADTPSRFSRYVAEGRLELPDEDSQATQFLEAHAILTESGYEHYEVSNFAIPGFESQHNLGYWQGKQYLGLGAGAHSYMILNGRPTRLGNIPVIEEYAKAILDNRSPAEINEEITAPMAIRERVMLELRTSGGIDPEKYGDRCDVIRKALDSVVERNWFVVEDGKYRPTPEGMLVADGMAGLMWDYLDELDDTDA